MMFRSDDILSYGKAAIDPKVIAVCPRAQANLNPYFGIGQKQCFSDRIKEKNQNALVLKPLRGPE